MILFLDIADWGNVHLPYSLSGLSECCTLQLNLSLLNYFTDRSSQPIHCTHDKYCHPRWQSAEPLLYCFYGKYIPIAKLPQYSRSHMALYICNNRTSESTAQYFPVCNIICTNHHSDNAETESKSFVPLKCYPIVGILMLYNFVSRVKMSNHDNKRLLITHIHLKQCTGHLEIAVQISFTSSSL